MRVKRYVVDTMPDAMHSIRSELGSDAVILSTKEIRTGGFMGMFRKKKIEVVAAVEKEQKKTAGGSRDTSSSVPRAGVPNAYRQAYASSSVNAAPGGTEPPRSFAEIAAALQGAAEKQGAVAVLTEKTVQETKLEAPVHVPQEEADSDQPAAAPSMASVSPERPTDDGILNEIKEMKQWIERIARQSAESRELPDRLNQLRERLIEQETDSALVEEWIGDVLDAWNNAGRQWPQEKFDEAIKEQVVNFLSTRIGGGVAPDTKLLYVAGPTGVGKTTTLAKLAADQLFRHGRKVGMITSDTYRISAVEQLRTYASILNVPLEVIQSPGDLQRALSRLEGCDLVLMDTAGRNFRNELLVAELQSLLAPTLKSETYLVLSLTSKSRDMKLITEHFSKYRLDKIIVTKLDETGSFGPMFNLLNDYPLSLSYMTNGQNVPDDLLVPSEELLCDLLLGTGEQ
ncbi:flagellar biosynthesis protein FlhF [Paenibacillus rhizophilus]|uniref:Flagellar biosynthesis protein FlhF n=1 Tax=Paenibacillus rhizophilus TaxID=1850366 RepID=A0A3N9PC12_9BACL|nr:flagellar biosynthesis protein FlhF [Paenibacillus rhizophilus]RQW13145.1 flagellar biosynthesis protein FlhF [Paenibacillus rhizophilus]